MSLWSGIANFGLGVGGYKDAQASDEDRAALLRQRARSEEIAGMELARLRREDDLAKNTRDIAAKYGIGGTDALPATPPADVRLPQVQSDEGDADTAPPIPNATVTKPGLPSQANRPGMYEAIAGEYEKAGKLGEAENIRKALKVFKQEGYDDMVRGVATGADPETIAQQFNQKGNNRIVSGTRQGDGYTFQYENGQTKSMTKPEALDLGTRMGIFKKDLTILPQGANALDATGNVVATGQPKVRNPPPWGPEAIAGKKDLEQFKFDLTHGSKGAVDPARVREVKYLSQFFNGDESAAVQFVYGNRDKSRTDQVLHIASLVKDDPDLAGDSKKVLKRAEEMADQLNAKSTSTRGNQRPSAAPASPLTDVQKDIEAANSRSNPGASSPDSRVPPALSVPGTQRSARFTGNFSAAGKPIYQDGADYFVAE